MKYRVARCCCIFKEHWYCDLYPVLVPIVGNHFRWLSSSFYYFPLNYVLSTDFSIHVGAEKSGVRDISHQERPT